MINQTIYNETLVDLRAKLEDKFGSVAKFAALHEIDKFNLYKLFNNTKGQEMSVGLFARIMTALGSPNLDNISNSNISLKQYLEIDNNAILKAILTINFT